MGEVVSLIRSGRVENTTRTRVSLLYFNKICLRENLGSLGLGVVGSCL